jgi:dolichol-phosphate mannosyltransferase
MITIVSPIYNEEDNIVELCERIVKTLESVGEEFEIILVENGSSDRSLEIIKSLHRCDPRIKYLSLSRNFGHQGAIIAGLCHAAGDAIVSLDGDLQHPPELIAEMIRLWREGYDVVYTTKKEKSAQNDWRNIPKRLFYRVVSHIAEVKLSYGQSDFRVLDRKVADVLCRIPERNKFLRGLVQWVGFRQTGIEYEVEPRKSGETKFSLRNYFHFALDGIFSFSTVPLRLFIWIGVIVATLCVLYASVFGVYGTINLLFAKRVLLPPGWATIAVTISFLGAVQLIGIGILGEYIGRIYGQTKDRPDFIVREKGLE